MASKSKLAQYFHFFTQAKEESLQVQGPENMLDLVEKIEALILILDERGRIIEFNSACERLSGYTRKEVLGREPDFLVPPAEKERLRKILQQLLTTEMRASYVSHWLTKSGQKRSLVWSSSKIEEQTTGKIKNIICFGLDITEIKAEEDRRLVILHLLEVLASPGDLNNILERILEIVRDYLGCAAAGIRLRKGEDYPYIKTLGFTEDFIKNESYLTCLEAGTIKRDEKGAVQLDCICGRVIRGEWAEKHQPFAVDGAFYTGNINDLAAKFSAQKLPFKIRNHCGKMGYKSIALIPLRFHDEIVGLLQLNDYEQDKFSDDEINFLTVAGQSIGAALVRFQAEQERQRVQLILDTVIRKAREGFSLSTQQGKFLIYNEAMERITGYSLEEVNRHGWFYLVFPNEDERRQAVFKARQAMAGKIDYMELVITHKNGARKPIALTLTPLEIDGITYNFSTVIDLSTKYEDETLF